MTVFTRKLFQRRSIRGTLIFYSVFLFAFFVPILLTSTLMGERFLQLPQAFSERSERLNRFYESVHTMDVQAQSYLYTRSGDGKAAFEAAWAEARGQLKALEGFFQDQDNEEFRWRLSLLDNMILTYRETLEKLESGAVSQAKYGGVYDFMVSTAQNIDRTRNYYSRLLSDDMTRSVLETKDRWRSLLIASYSVLLALLVVAALFSTVTVRSITAPLHKLVKNIQKIKQGQYDLKEISFNHYEEIDVVCDAFQDMASSLDGYIRSLEQNAALENKLLEKDNENLRISELLTKTELKALQAQMNPHFLFNTLSMLSKLAYIEGAYQTSELMDTVADLMRYSLDKSSRASDLMGEIECLKNYITIQTRRFGSRIRFQVAVDPNVINLIMPGMVLQPLVENAILHGVGKMQKGALIDVLIYCDPDSIFLEVRDNGAGMDQECVEMILSGGDASASQEHTSIGFQNVFRRLNLFFGSRYRVILCSELEGGTDVIITLPRTAQEEPHHV
jgi:sensor histidine kinase YesM